MTIDIIQKAIDFAFEKATKDAIPGMESAQSLAENYIRKYPNNKKLQADNLINSQIKIAATAGFVTSFGGLIAMPITIPANLAAGLYLQTRMAAAIARIGGRNLNDEDVKNFVQGCLIGKTFVELLKKEGVKYLAKKLAPEIGVRVSRLVVTEMLTKVTAKGASNLAKAVPLLGGVVGGTLDAVWTKSVGETAKKLFIEDVMSDA